MSDERRSSPRVAVPTQGACTIRDESGAERAFELTDLSESGARLTCGVAIGAMTRVHVAMRLPGERVGRADEAQLETIGVVVWSHSVGEGSYDTGVFFPELDEESAALLQAYVLSAV
jgi:hypothetical protein